MKRTKLLALLGAALLTVGTVGIALAEELKEPHRGVTITWDENGDPVVEDANGDPVDFPVNDPEDCLDDNEEPLAGEGQILIHFVQSPTEANEGTLDVDFDGATDVNDQPQDGNQGNQLDWDVDVTATDDTVVIVTAESSVGDDDKDLKISHICVGDQAATTTTTEETTTTTDETTTTDTTTTDTGGEGGLTEPPTDGLGSNRVSSPADSAWLLVVALGVLLASLVVLSPARSRR